MPIHSDHASARTSTGPQDWQNSPLVLRRAAIPAALLAEKGHIAGRAAGDCVTGDLLIEDGRVRRFLDNDERAPDAYEIDLANRILTPLLTEPHCHLDKCHTISRLENVGGDLQAAGAVQRVDREGYTPEDLRARAGRGLAEFAAAGCGTVRSHVDWPREIAPTGEVPLAWHVLGELAEEWSGRIELQRTALLSLDQFEDRDYISAAAERIRADNGVLGVFVYDDTQKAARLGRVLDIAARHDLALDFHVDEGLEEGLNGLTTIAEVVTERRFAQPVLCGHACSLMNLTGAALERAIEKISAAGIAVVALPSTNLYLQGRGAGTPERRGVTRVRELRQAGITVAFGTDNVGDAFCPLGRHDPMTSLATGVLSAHLDPPYGPWLETITTAARKAVGLAPQTVDGARVATLLVSEARHTAELIAGAHIQRLTAFLAARQSGA